VRLRMLQREGSERLSVTTSPRLSTRVIQREQLIESRRAGIAFLRVRRATLRTSRAEHLWE
jgi:hypothetical protein